MTSIEWLEQELQKRFPKETYDMYNNNQFSYEDMIIKSKRMHKQEIIDAWENAPTYLEDKKGEDYYQETFVNKGSDEHICTYEKCPQCLKAQLPQQEISDEEIEKAANRHFEGDLMWSERIAFKLAIKWYREQLKQRQ